MATKEKLRTIVLNKVKRLSEDKLSNLDSFLDDLESQQKQERTSLSYTGIFSDLDLEDLTTDLHRNRADQRDRIPTF